jgi:hypothetical protein
VASVVPLRPPAIRTLPFANSVAVWFWVLAGSAVVPVQVVTPFHRSAVSRDPVLLAPPATSSVPFDLTIVDSSVAV